MFAIIESLTGGGWLSAARCRGREAPATTPYITGSKKRCGWSVAEPAPLFAARVYVIVRLMKELRLTQLNFMQPLPTQCHIAHRYGNRDLGSRQIFGMESVLTVPAFL